MKIMVLLVSTFFMRAWGDTGDPLPLDLAFQPSHFGIGEIPQCSPDGRYLAWTIRQPTEGRTGGIFTEKGTPAPMAATTLRITDTHTNETIKPGPTNGNSWRPVWSPDSKRLAFYSDAGDMPQLWVWQVNDTRARKVSDARIKAKAWAGDAPVWRLDGSGLYVPLAPPQAESATRLPMPRQSLQTPMPQVFFSGTEQLQPPSEASPDPRPGSDPLRNWIMQANHAMIGDISLTDGAVKILYDHEQEVPASVLRLSPSGKHISFLSVYYRNESNTYTLFVDLGLIDTNTGNSRILARGLPFTGAVAYDRNYRWHPTREALAYVVQDRLMWLDLDKKTEALPLLKTGERAGHHPLFTTRDGKYLLIGLDPHMDDDRGLQAPGRLAFYHLEHDRIRHLQLNDQWLFQQAITLDNRTLWQPRSHEINLMVTHRATGDSAVIAVSPRRDARVLWRESAVVSHWHGTDHQQLTAIYQNVGTAPDIFLFNKDFTPKKRLTELAPELDKVKATDVIFFESKIPLYDGSLETVRTAVLMPRGRTGPLPALVGIYPGADLTDGANRFGGMSFTTMPNPIFTTRDYAVVLTNIPLQAEGQAGNPVSQMVDALLPQVYRAAQMGYVDSERLALIGQSYGGYGTAAVLSRTNLFRAGIAISGLYDLSGHYGDEADGGWYETGQGRMGDHPWNAPRRYLDNSPYYHADKIKTPLLLIHGDADPAVNEAKKLYKALERLDRTAQLAVYPGQGHGIGGWDSKLAADAAQRTLDFLERHLKLSD